MVGLPASLATLFSKAKKYIRFVIEVEMKYNILAKDSYLVIFLCQYWLTNLICYYQITAPVAKMAELSLARS